MKSKRFLGLSQISQSCHLQLWTLMGGLLNGCCMKPLILLWSAGSIFFHLHCILSKISLKSIQFFYIVGKQDVLASSKSKQNSNILIFDHFRADFVNLLGRGNPCGAALCFDCLRLRRSSAPAEKSTFFKTAITLSIFILFEPGFFHYPRDTLRFLNCPRTARLDEN